MASLLWVRLPCWPQTKNEVNNGRRKGAWVLELNDQGNGWNSSELWTKLNLLFLLVLSSATTGTAGRKCFSPGSIRHIIRIIFYFVLSTPVRIGFWISDALMQCQMLPTYRSINIWKTYFDKPLLSLWGQKSGWQNSACTHAENINNFYLIQIK